MTERVDAGWLDEVWAQAKEDGWSVFHLTAGQPHAERKMQGPWYASFSGVEGEPRSIYGYGETPKEAVREALKGVAPTGRT